MDYFSKHINYQLVDVNKIKCQLKCISSGILLFVIVLLMNSCFIMLFAQQAIFQIKYLI